MEAVGKRIAAHTYKQAEYDLRITVSSLFRKAGLAQVVLIIRFKVKCGDIMNSTPIFPPNSFAVWRTLMSCTTSC